MAVVVEMHNTGNPGARSEVVAMIEHALSDPSGDWRVSIIGLQANDRWEMEITGPLDRMRSSVPTRSRAPLVSMRRLLLDVSCQGWCL
jgi:hypothetical protein